MVLNSQPWVGPPEDLVYSRKRKSEDSVLSHFFQSLEHAKELISEMEKELKPRECGSRSQGKKCFEGGCGNTANLLTDNG